MPYSPAVRTVLRSAANLLGPLAILACFAVAYSAEIWLRTRSFYVSFDNVEQFYPWYQKLATSVHRGVLPLWDAGPFGGRSFVGEFQTGVFYPVNLAFVWLFGNRDGIDIIYLEALVVLHYLIASVGTFVLLRGWGADVLAALAGAVVFAYTGGVAARATGQVCIFYGLTLLPWALHFASVSFRGGRVRASVAAGVVLGLQIDAGHIQPFFHTALLIAFLAGSLLWAERARFSSSPKRLVVRGGVMLAVAVIVALPQLGLGIEYMNDTYRWVGAERPVVPGEKVPFEVIANKHVLVPSALASIVDQDAPGLDDGNTLYIGWVPLLVLLAAFAVRRTKSPLLREHAIFLFATLAFALAMSLGAKGLLIYALYHLPLIDKVRELGRYLIMAHLALCVMVGFGVHALARAGARGRIAIELVLLVAIGASVLHARTRSSQDTNEQTYAPRFFAADPVIDSLLKSDGLFRVADSAGADAAMPRNIGDVYPLQTKMGYAATMYRPYKDLLDRDWSDDGFVNDLLNVRYVVTKADLSFRKIAENTVTGRKLYERSRFFPRIFLESRLEPCGAEPSCSRHFRTLYYEDERQGYEVTIEQATDRVIAGEVDYPGWCAYVDGARVAIRHPTLHGQEAPLRAVDMQAGTHRLEFEYHPLRCPARI